jgi:aminoglycoside phosphotransferase (APT) family kinase protein
VTTDAAGLPADLLDWVGEVAGGTVTAANRVPGGASREAWFVDVERAEGDTLPLFVRYSRRPTPADSAFHSLRTEAEIFAALQETDVTVPRTYGVHPVHEAMLAERVSGQTWFARIRGPDEQVRVAQDFIRNLAALHRLDPATLTLPSLGPVKTPREHALDELAGMRRRAGEAETIDPLVRIALDWLERNVPDDASPVVLVQGDTGPGNFLYEDGRVTAVLDWELAHLGDPMDDIAWLSLRTVQDTFTHFPDRLREYEELSGHRVEAARVWYYRLFAETRLTTSRPAARAAPPPREADADVQPVYADLGNPLIYNMLHRRLTMEALAHVMAVRLPEVDLFPTPPPEPEEWHAHYDSALGSLLAIVPRIDDPLAAGWAKGLARLVKYLKETDAYGRAFARDELEDIAALVGRGGSGSLRDARARLAEASNAGQVADEDYVGYAWRRLCRDDYLLRTASGVLATRTWPPLE